MAEVGFAAIMLAISAAVWWASQGLPPAMLEPIGSAVFPRVVASILALLALVVLGGAARRHDPASGGSAETGAGRPGLALATLLISIAYIAAMEVELLGFRAATVAYLLALGAVLVDFDRRRLAVIAAIAVIVGVGAHYVFTRLFYVDLP